MAASIRTTNDNRADYHLRTTIARIRGLRGSLLSVGTDYPVEPRTLWAEVEKQTYLELRRLQVAQQLLWGFLVEVQGRLEFEYQRAVDDHVQPLDANLLSLVGNGNRNLTLNRVSPRDQLARQRLCVE